MQKATPGASVVQIQTLCQGTTRQLASLAKWPLRVMLLLSLIAAFASEPVAAKPTAKGRTVSGTKTRLRPRLQPRIVSQVDVHQFEFQEPFLAGDLLGPALWSVYVVLGLAWFRSAAPRRAPSAQKLVRRARRTESSRATRSLWNALRRAQMRPRWARFRSLAREHAALVN
jgi:hypothetical protein